MARAADLIVILLYGVIAAGAAVAFERLGLMTSDVAWLMGAVVFLIAGQAHAATARALEKAELSRALHEQRAANLSLAEEIEAIQSRLDSLEAVKIEAPDTDAIVHAVMRRLPAGRTASAEPGPDPLADAFADPHEPPAESAEARALRRAKVAEAVSENRIDLYMQPVVTLPQRRTAFYEAFTRLRDRDGQLIEPLEFLDVAEEAGLMGEIDALLVLRCTRILRRLAKADRRSALFCNLSPQAFEDEAGFSDFMEFLKRNQDLAGALIFEMSQAAFAARSARAQRNMARMADLGFRFSIDSMTDLDVDLAVYQEAGVRFAKIEAERFIRAAHGQSGLAGLAPGAIRPEDAAGVFARYGLDVIVEEIESEADVVEVLDLDVAYGQGYLFGAPRAVKEDLLAGLPGQPAAPRPATEVDPRRRADG